MKSVLRQLQVYTAGKFEHKTLNFTNGTIGVSKIDASGDASQLHNCYLFPGFADVHVHFREPGFSYKETIRTGTLAAAHGGYTDVCTMPNLKPVPDCAAHLQPQLQAIEKDACIRVHPYGAITRGQQGEELADFDAIADHVIAFSDDGRGVQSESMMRQAMEYAKQRGKLIVAHCEDNSLLHGGYIHDGVYARTHGHKGICSESEWGPIARDLELAKQTGCGYHVCHISCKESVELIRRAKREGVDVTCETAPHYLVLDETMLQEDGRFKMNPPLRGVEDRLALVEGICDGTIDMIATDHAPHSAEEKAGGLSGSLNGIVGLETAFAVLYTALVRPGTLRLEQLVALMADNPRRRFGLPLHDGDYTIFHLDSCETVQPERFLSMGHSTPFAGMQVWGKCMLTAVDGAAVWKDPDWEQMLLAGC